MARRVDDRGQVAPLLVIVVLVVVGALIVLVHVGRIAVVRAQVQTAADAAALAGAAEGRPAAERLARDNGASLESFTVDGNEVQVVVERNEVRATARARRDDG